MKYIVKPDGLPKMVIDIDNLRELQDEIIYRTYHYYYIHCDNKTKTVNKTGNTLNIARRSIWKVIKRKDLESR
jgi:hypothetical protein